MIEYSLDVTELNKVQRRREYLRTEPAMVDTDIYVLKNVDFMS
jgi:hypothetical protein